MPGSSLVVWFEDKTPILLVGKESIYVSDISKDHRDFRELYKSLIEEI
jgi:hypothetical protein